MLIIVIQQPLKLPPASSFSSGSSSTPASSAGFKFNTSLSEHPLSLAKENFRFLHEIMGESMALSGFRETLFDSHSGDHEGEVKHINIGWSPTILAPIYCQRYTQWEQ